MSQSSYYDRHAAKHLDGTPIFATSEDRKSEEEVARIIESTWGCEVRSFGSLAIIDWYAMRDGRMVSLLELKTRSHSSTRYQTVFLNVRKYMALFWGQACLNVPALFCVRFTDEIRWIRVYDIDATKHKIGGCASRVKSVTDIEPVIEVPVAKCKILGRPSGGRTRTSEDNGF